MTPRTLLPFAMLAVIGCSGRGGDTGGSNSGGDDTSTGGDDTGANTGGFTISGTALVLGSSQPATSGLCIEIADPTPAISGGELTILAQSTIGDNGAFSVSGVHTSSTIGLLMLVEDCEGQGPTVMPTATGISADSYAGLGDGDTLGDEVAWSIDGATGTQMQDGLALAGYTGELSTDGALIGFVVDQNGQPIDGATVTGGNTTTYYATPTGFDTTATSAEADAMFVIPAAPIYTYTCTADGYEFDSLLAGSQPGYAVIVQFVAN